MLEEVLSHSGGTIETSPSCPLRLPKVLFSFWNSNLVIEATLLTNSLISLASLPFMGTSSIRWKDENNAKIHYNAITYNLACASNIGHVLLASTSDSKERDQSKKSKNSCVCLRCVVLNSFVLGMSDMTDGCPCAWKHTSLPLLYFWEVPLRLKL